MPHLCQTFNCWKIPILLSPYSVKVRAVPEVTAVSTRNTSELVLEVPPYSEKDDLLAAVFAKRVVAIYNVTF